MAEDVRDEVEQEPEWNHLLVEWDKVDPLYEPIKASARIKVCFKYLHHTDLWFFLNMLHVV